MSACGGRRIWKSPGKIELFPDKENEYSLSVVLIYALVRIEGLEPLHLFGTGT